MVAVPQCSAERAQTSFTTFSAPPQEGGEGVGGQGEVFGLFVCLNLLTDLMQLSTAI